DLLGSPELLFRPLALGNLFFQLLVGSQKLAGSLRDALIEFLCDPLLLAQESRLLQSDHCLVRRQIKKKSLSLRWKIRALGTHDAHTQFSVQAQSQKQNGNVSLSNRIPHARRRSV